MLLAVLINEGESNRKLPKMFADIKTFKKKKGQTQCAKNRCVCNTNFVMTKMCCKGLL